MSDTGKKAMVTIKTFLDGQVLPDWVLPRCSANDSPASRTADGPLSAEDEGLAGHRGVFG
jgi:hypothetical protein